MLQNPPTFRHFIGCLMACLGAGAGASALPARSAVPAAVPQSAAEVQSAAGAEAARHLPAVTEKQRLLVGPLPQRLQVAQCAQPLQSVVGSAPHMNDRLLVEIKCPDSPAWHLYVPVRVVGTSRVAVAAHAILAGSVLSASDLRAEQHDMSELPPGYLDDLSIAVGHTAVRPIAAGAILTNQLLVASKAVQRGQTVTLVADAGGISVRMAGRALTDGLINQRVRVQNLSSGKMVEGIARSEQVVEIIFQ